MFVSRFAAGKVPRLVGWVAPMAFFGLALWVLHGSLEEYRYSDIVAAFRALTKAQLALALAVTTCGYLVLAGYDLLAFRFIRCRLRLRDLALTSFVSGALGNNLGNILVTGAAVRYWIYTALRLSATEITKVVLFCSLGFWLGFLLLSGLLFAFTPIALPMKLDLPVTTRPLGFVLLALLGCYLGVVAARRTPLTVGRLQLRLPSPALTLGQLAVASLDLCLMAAALYVVLPATAPVSYVHFTAIFLLALLAANASLVPGGVGVFETVVLLLSPRASRPEVAAALFAFRGIYFILPLFVAIALVGARESRKHVSWLSGLVKRGSGRMSTVLPPILAAAIFLSGTILVLSGALPAAGGRLASLHRFVALPVIETSHFVASLVGAALLLLAHAIQRRLDGAYLLALVLLAAGSVLSLAKGWDYEEAIVLGITFALLLPFRGYFYRKASFLGEPFTRGWIASIGIVIAGSAWLGVFAHTHPLYSGEPWWRFALHAEASRSLRATVGAVSVAVLFAIAQLLRPVRPRLTAPGAADIERARPIIERSLWTYPNLAFRRDKALLFSQSGNAFLMYGRMGRSWIAMGDPVGCAGEARELLWQFRDLSDRFDGWCVFFEVRPEHLDTYVDLGLTLTQLGEEARIELAHFSLEGSAHKDLRQARSKATRSCRFEILPREAVSAALPALAHISDAWLAEKATHEKGFSNASFDARYLTHFPVAVVRRGEQIIAFANLWQSAEKEELSVDLMRHVPDAPNGTMDFLFTELLLWGRQAGYRWFNFGMAPLSGLAAHPGAPLWDRVGTFVYRHGEHFYNFRGLRRYKQKFAPVWTPLYLASPGGIALPAILLDVTALIAGGLTGIVSKRAPRA
jgi:phosphatidylglycerol lysyltransferase